jgi:electron transfer flavoprotein alpha subunit
MILVYVDHDRGVLDEFSLQAVAAARSLDADVQAVMVGADAVTAAARLGEFGVTTTHVAVDPRIADYTPMASGRAVAQMARQRDGGGARVEDDVVARFHQPRRIGADALLLLVVDGILLAYRMLGRRRARQGRAAVAARGHALRFQRIQVAADGDRGHAEFFHQIGHLHRALLGKHLEDGFTALAGISHGGGLGKK